MSTTTLAVRRSDAEERHSRPMSSLRDLGGRGLTQSPKLRLTRTPPPLVHLHAQGARTNILVTPAGRFGAHRLTGAPFPKNSSGLVEFGVRFAEERSALVAVQ